MSTTVYGLKNCDTCKKATKWLDRFDVPYTFVDYRENKPSPEMLLEWAAQLGGLAAMVNKSSTTWRQLPDNRQAAASDAEWKLLLREYPQLIKRPVVEWSNGSVTVGFAPDDWADRG